MDRLRPLAVGGLALALLVIAAFTAEVGNHRPPRAAPVSAYPSPGARAASPETQISLRGVGPEDIGTVTVTGSRSGAHATTVRADSDGNGVSLYLDDALDPGETVSVDTSLDVYDAKDGDYRFTVARPIEQHVAADDDGDAEEPEPAKAHDFASAPALKPPVVTVDHGSLDADDGDIFLGPYNGAGQYGPLIVTPDGDPVWFQPLPDGLSAFNLRVQQFRGAPVLTWWEGRVTHGHGLGVGQIYDDTYQPIATVEAGNGYSADLHDFVITADDTALLTIYQPVRWDLSAVGGPRDGAAVDGIFQEIDIATGNVLVEWHSLDHVPLTDSYQAFRSDQNGRPENLDYFHINSVQRESDGSFLVSARATHTIYLIDGQSGRPIWRLGGKRSTFTGAGTDFSSQHDAVLHGDGMLTLFDNAAGVGDPTSDRSSGMLVSLDEDRFDTILVRRYATEDDGRSSSQGDMQLLPGGAVFIGWGNQPRFSQFDADGTLVYEASLPSGFMNYRAFRSVWSARPATPPAVAVTESGSGLEVAASWNGATSVASWQVIAAASAAGIDAAGQSGAPEVVASGPATGFETTLAVDGRPAAYLAVRALADDGTVLGTSAAVPVGG